MSEVWINDVDLGDYGFALGQLGDIATTERASALAASHASAPQMSDAMIALLGQLGPTWAGEPVQASARSLIIGGFCTGASQADFLAKVDALKGLISGGAVRMRLADRPTQEYRDCRLLSFSANPRAALLQNLAGDVSFSLQIADPLRYDVNPQGIALTTSRAAVPIGTAPCYPVIIVNGGGAALSAIVLTYRNAAGDAAQTMGFTGSLGANDYLIIDCVKGQVTKSVAGVQSDALSWWTSGDFLIIRPADGWYESAAYPTLEVAGTGTPHGVASYCRSWL